MPEWVALGEGFGVRRDGAGRAPVLLDVDRLPHRARHGDGGGTLAPNVTDEDATVARGGWAIVCAPGLDPAVREAVAPLLRHRRDEGGESVVELEWAPGESADDFERRTRAELEARGYAPKSGLASPLHLLVLGGPEGVPFDVQQDLSAGHWVGRLAFDRPEQYEAYARSLVAYEGGGGRGVRDGTLAVWATRHGFDGPTQLSADRLASRVPQEQRWDSLPHVDARIGAAAMRSALLELLGRPGAGRRASLVFTASHGAESAAGEADQRALQGALVAQEWRKGAPLEGGRTHVAAGDVGDDADVAGMAAFFFGCFTAGTPTHDGIGEVVGARIAAQPFVSALAQRLLSHPRGAAIGVIGHVDRALTSSIRVPRQGFDVSPFDRALRFALASRTSLGRALSSFSVRADERAGALLRAIATRAAGGEIDPLKLSTLWCEHRDAQGFVLLGDPAARLRFDDRVG
jgi:hypothetical protein